MKEEKPVGDKSDSHSAIARRLDPASSAGWRVVEIGCPPTQLSPRTWFGVHRKHKASSAIPLWNPL